MKSDPKALQEAISRAARARGWTGSEEATFREGVVTLAEELDWADWTRTSVSNSFATFRGEAEGLLKSAAALAAKLESAAPETRQILRQIFGESFGRRFSLGALREVGAIPPPNLEHLSDASSGTSTDSAELIGLQIAWGHQVGDTALQVVVREFAKKLQETLENARKQAKGGRPADERRTLAFQKLALLEAGILKKKLPRMPTTAFLSTCADLFPDLGIEGDDAASDGAARYALEQQWKRWHPPAGTDPASSPDQT